MLRSEQLKSVDANDVGVWYLDYSAEHNAELKHETAKHTGVFLVC